MENDTREPKSYVIGPEGDVLTLANLPSLDTVRWVPRKKAELIAAVSGGLLSLSEVCERYNITPEEFLDWQTAMNSFGLIGLQATSPAGHRLLRKAARLPTDGAND